MCQLCDITLYLIAKLSTCRLHSAGAYRALNATCSLLSDDDTASVTCPPVDLRIQPVCVRTGTRGSASVLHHLGWYILGIIAMFVLTCH